MKKIWTGDDTSVNEVEVELWSPDEDNEYKFVIRGHSTAWLNRADVRELVWAILREELRS